MGVRNKKEKVPADREITDKIELWKEMEIAHWVSMDGYRNIVKFVYNHHNEIVIDNGTEVKRLVGVASDNDDHYYVLEDIKGKRIYSSCVGRLIILKNKINDDEYEYMESLYVRNHSDICMTHPTDEERKQFKEFFKLK